MPDAKNGSDSPIQDKEGTNIDVGDQVFTKFRGGKREGEVDDIATTPEEAQQQNAKHPPKVIFNDQHGHRVAHNPETLTVTETEEEKK